MHTPQTRLHIGPGFQEHILVLCLVPNAVPPHPLGREHKHHVYSGDQPHEHVHQPAQPRVRVLVVVGGAVGGGPQTLAPEGLGDGCLEGAGLAELEALLDGEQAPEDDVVGEDAQEEGVSPALVCARRIVCLQETFVLLLLLLFLLLLFVGFWGGGGVGREEGGEMRWWSE